MAATAPVGSCRFVKFCNSLASRPANSEMNMNWICLMSKIVTFSLYQIVLVKRSCFRSCQNLAKWLTKYGFSRVDGPRYRHV